MGFHLMKNSTNVSGDEYFNYVCKDEEAREKYHEAVAGLEDRINQWEIDFDNLNFEHENLLEQYGERDELCTALIALCFKLEKCRSVKQVRELINQHRMDRYEDYI